MSDISASQSVLCNSCCFLSPRSPSPNDIAEARASATIEACVDVVPTCASPWPRLLAFSVRDVKHGLAYNRAVSSTYHDTLGSALALVSVDVIGSFLSISLHLSVSPSSLSLPTISPSYPICLVSMVALVSLSCRSPLVLSIILLAFPLYVSRISLLSIASVAINCGDRWYRKDIRQIVWACRC